MRGIRDGLPQSQLTQDQRWEVTDRMRESVLENDAVPGIHDAFPEGQTFKNGQASMRDMSNVCQNAAPAGCHLLR